MTGTWQELKAIQPEVMTMLKNSITKDRVAHAYLFEGEKGTGKRETGLVFAKSLLCKHPVDGYQPCNECLNCKRITSGNHPDVHIVEPEGLSIKKEQIKNLQEEFSMKSVELNRKIYRIVHADKMSIQAANSLLKFLEEPQSDTVAILMTEQIQRMLPTILSRCQILPFKPLSPENVKKRLIEHGVDGQTASVISMLTHNFDEGLEISAEEWFAQAQKIVLKLYEVLKTNPMKALVYLHEEWFLHFKEKEQLDRGLDLLFLIYKDLLYIQLDKRNLVIFQNKLGEFESHALHLSQRSLADKMGFILEAKRKLMSNTNPQLLMEQLVLNLQEGSSFV
ncbi:DNA polymerase III subunit delta' [Peribacillus cavernae]|uniref:DNA polymerase III subunit delta n=1 Tax=Peribacillus cavernae TaxID=1674310 RepID=A0A433HFW2_9BACI|nr:DNA polymerase III subunit delta' [Peribacillus cavernae]MDQ0220919.1 DNA polymerase-3 subunit delta' [Peribacillus cavernae]RUQ27266.1 DNA polymerase III subunit delta' [Peribacillus cavernae]